MSMLKSLLDYLKSKTKFGVMSLLFVLIFLLYFWHNIVVTVNPGYAAVKFSRLFGGIITDRIYMPGTHLIFPWDRLTIYSTRIQAEDETIQALTYDGLAVNISIALRYQLIENKLPVLQKLIGSEYSNIIIKPIVTSIVRQKIGHISVESLYSHQIAQTLEDLLLIGAIQAMGKIPITINAFVVTKITLPIGVTKAIEEKLIAEQEVLKYKYIIEIAQEEAKRLNIEGVGIRHYQQLINDNMTAKFLQYEGIKASKSLAESKNAKIVIFGGGEGNLPLIMNMAETNEKMQDETNDKTIDGNAIELLPETANNKKTLPIELSPKIDNSNALPSEQEVKKDVTTDNTTQGENTSAESTYEIFMELMKRLDKVLQTP